VYRENHIMLAADGASYAVGNGQSAIRLRIGISNDVRNLVGFDSIKDISLRSI
jgi:hypothetical protein